MKRCNVLLLKRHIGSFSLLQKDTLFQYHIPLERLYKQRKMVRRKVSLWSTSEDQKKEQSPRKKL
jgi:hypothetical protein